MIKTRLAYLLVSSLFFISFTNAADQKANVEAFFTQMNKEVDFEKEIGHANDKDQAKVLGWLSCVYGAFVLILLFIPNSMSARWALFGCGGFMMSVGLALLAYSRKSVSEAPIPIAEIELD
ncbi:hypothetical protein PQO03_16080 [Lentisphaera profundi]|uniref:Uncharacterized protein n=1 Tax=Lentisphaera profundi TaxID=1658616 RepID=A0ABY7W1P6_9BACT|nr:hypothetical protein [Lentisphaera profundi]WDE99355.1 hypothetical protein PQO03_16080 [Lentisphaera profundi]